LGTVTGTGWVIMSGGVVIVVADPSTVIEEISITVPPVVLAPARHPIANPSKVLVKKSEPDATHPNWEITVPLVSGPS